mgnify:CR=1 FL=1
MKLVLYNQYSHSLTLLLSFYIYIIALVFLNVPLILKVFFTYYIVEISPEKSFLKLILHFKVYLRIIPYNEINERIKEEDEDLWQLEIFNRYEHKL